MSVIVGHEAPTLDNPNVIIRSEVWCYVRHPLATLRIVLDTIFLLFTMFWSAMGGWSKHWVEIYRFKWLAGHITLSVWEIGVHPPEMTWSMDHKVCIERLHLFVYRALTLWAMASDCGVIYTTARSIQHDDDDISHAQSIERIVIVMVVFLVNTWRLAEIFWPTIQKVHVHRTVTHADVSETLYGSTHGDENKTRRKMVMTVHADPDRVPLTVTTATPPEEEPQGLSEEGRQLKRKADELDALMESLKDVTANASTGACYTDGPAHTRAVACRVCRNPDTIWPTRDGTLASRTFYGNLCEKHTQFKYKRKPY